MLPHLPLLSPFGQLWYVTITPYGRDLEPFVPEKERVLADFQALSRFLGSRRIIWRYDPIVLTEKYTPEYHLRGLPRHGPGAAGKHGNLRDQLY